MNTLREYFTRILYMNILREYFTWIIYMNTWHEYFTWTLYMNTLHGYFTLILYMNTWHKYFKWTLYVKTLHEYFTWILYMNTNKHFRSHHFFLERETFQTKAAQRIKTQNFMSNNFFRKSCLLSNKVEKKLYSQTGLRCQEGAYELRAG